MDTGVREWIYRKEQVAEPYIYNNKSFPPPYGLSKKKLYIYIIIVRENWPRSFLMLVMLFSCCLLC